jgi:amino-acid N-acetyltransferase
MNTSSLAIALVQPSVAPGIVLEQGTPADAVGILALVQANADEGHLLPRDLEEICLRAHRFVVARRADEIVACAELAPLGPDVAEVRSLVVDRQARSLGVGSQVVDRLVHRATTAGFRKLCAFTHAPAFFINLGFSIVPHVWIPEKIVTDCRSCPHFRKCGQYAVVRPLTRMPHAHVPLASLHG